MCAAAAVVLVVAGPAVPAGASPVLTAASSFAAGTWQTCAVTSGGAAMCWGANGRGQLGNGTTTDSSVPVVVSGLASGVASVAVGGDHACALTTAGAVSCWGTIRDMANAVVTSSTTPVAVTGLGSGVAAISAGIGFTCALTTAGGAKCWGVDYLGQLGNSSYAAATTPVDVTGLASGVTSVVAGGSHACAITTGGALKCWGNDSAGQLGDGTTSFPGRNAPVAVTGLSSGVLQVVGGDSDTCALLTGGSVACWGANASGEVGDGTTTSPRTSPTSVSGLGSGVASIGAGGHGECAVTTAEAVRCWGAGAYGQRGDGTVANATAPVDVPNLSPGAASVRGGESHTCALTTGGTLRCWGSNTYGQLGNGASTSTASSAVAGLGGVAAKVSVGNSHTCVLTAAGEPRCWGSNTVGQLGNGTLVSSATPVTPQGSTSGFTSISAGGDHSCAVNASGGAVCWGSNSAGQLGNGSTTDSPVPVAVTGLASGVVAVTAGSTHTCALTSAHGVKCWGSNSAGELGNGSTSPSSVPQDVTGLGSGVGAISAGGQFSCAVTTGGDASCWGNNVYGRFGNAAASSSTPVVAYTGYKLAQLAAGTNHTCAVTTTGVALCAGYGEAGQLGNGSTPGSTTAPVAVVGFGSATAVVAAGTNESCGANTAGAVRCWGTDSDDQLGDGRDVDGTSMNTPTPVAVLGLATSDAVSIGGLHGCAIDGAGAVRCWGNGTRGRLGLPQTPHDVSGGLTFGPVATGLLRVTTSPAVPSQITVDGAIADSWGLQWVKEPVGPHTVCFRAVAGFATPACQVTTVTAGATSTVTGSFTARGYLQVSTVPPVASRISVDGIPRDNWGLYTDLPVGPRLVCFGAVAGHTPPPCQTVTLTAGATSAVTGTFTASAVTGLADVGRLRVTTSPAVPSQITVDGAIADTWGLNWLEIAPGSHTICFTALAGYSAPPCQTVTVLSGATTTVVGPFAPRGYLRVDTSPAVAATITLDGVPADDWGVFTDLPPGPHVVCFGAVPGHIAPPCQTPTVIADNTTAVTGTYT